MFGCAIWPPNGFPSHWQTTLADYRDVPQLDPPTDTKSVPECQEIYKWLPCGNSSVAKPSD